MPQMKLASDYYSNEEMASFKKPKSKKKKIRKKMLKVIFIPPKNVLFIPPKDVFVTLEQ